MFPLTSHRVFAGSSSSPDSVSSHEGVNSKFTFDRKPSNASTEHDKTQVGVASLHYFLLVDTHSHTKSLKPVIPPCPQTPSHNSLTGSTHSSDNIAAIAPMGDQPPILRRKVTSATSALRGTAEGTREGGARRPMRVSTSDSAMLEENAAVRNLTEINRYVRGLLNL